MFAATWAVVRVSASGALRLLPDVPAPFASGCVSDAAVDALPEKKVRMSIKPRAIIWILLHILFLCVPSLWGDDVQIYFSCDGVLVEVWLYLSSR